MGMLRATVYSEYLYIGGKEIGEAQAGFVEFSFL